MTPNIGAPDWEGPQAAPWDIHNEANRYLEAFATRARVADRDLDAPPGSCADGAAYLIDATASGLWLGHDGEVAIAVGTNASNGWRFVEVEQDGFELYLIDEGISILWDGAAWVTSGSGTAGTLDYDTDGTLAANSDAKIATQKATKTYVDNAVTGLLELKGATDCSANPNYPAAMKGDSYIVSVAGKIGGASGKLVDAGDVYLATADNAGGNEATVGTSWIVLEHNLVGVLLAANDLSDVASPSTARSNLGATTVGANIFTAANPSAITFLRVNADNSVSLLNAASFRTAIGAGTGSGSGDMVAANNLSDVASPGTSRTNLGVGTGDSPQFTGINLGHASDTTLTRTGAGDIAIEGNAVYRAGGTDVAVADGGTGASTAAAARTNLGVDDIRVSFFFTSIPTASEVLALYIASDAFTIPANFATPNSVGVIGTNPTASFAIDVQRQVNATGAFSTIGTITISTGGAFTFATASGTSKSIAANDVLKFIAPGSADATAANCAITVRGTK